MEFNDCDVDFLEEVDRLEKAYIQQHAQQSAPIQIKPPVVNPQPVITSPNKTVNQNQYKSLQNNTPIKVQPTSTNLRQSVNQTQQHGNNIKLPPAQNLVPSPVEFQLANPQSFALQTTDIHLINALYQTPNVYYDTHNGCFIYPLSSYDEIQVLCRKFSHLKVGELPDVIRSVFMSPPKPEPEVKLDRIPSELLSRLYAFQREGVIYAIKRNGRCLIADEMGLGKTIQAIAIAAYYREDWPILVLVPSSLRFQWAQAFLEYFPDLDGSDINVVLNGKGSCDKLVNIVSYDLAPRLEKNGSLRRLKFVIADESHMLRAHDSLRTKVAVPVIQSATRAILLSGTPALNRPKELFQQLNALDSKSFPQFFRYGCRYCAGYCDRFNWNWEGASNMTELHLLLERTVMIRRMKKDVMSQLPSKHRQQIYVAVSENYKQMLHQIESIAKETKKSMYKANREKMFELRSDKRKLMMELYRNTGRVKLPAVVDYLSDLLENTEAKFLVFAHHKDVLDGMEMAIKKGEYPYIRIDGSTSPLARKDLQDLFQKDDQCRVALLSITAAGTGLNFTSASMVVFAELFWNPGTLRQAEDRCHRIGQQAECVDIRYLLAKNTVDEVIWDMINSKMNVLGSVLNGEEDSIETEGAEEVENSNGGLLSDDFIDRMIEKLSTFGERWNDRKVHQMRRKELKTSGHTQNPPHPNNENQNNDNNTSTQPPPEPEPEQEIKKRLHSAKERNKIVIELDDEVPPPKPAEAVPSMDTDEIKSKLSKFANQGRKKLRLAPTED